MPHGDVAILACCLTVGLGGVAVITLALIAIWRGYKAD